MKQMKQIQPALGHPKGGSPTNFWPRFRWRNPPDRGLRFAKSLSGRQWGQAATAARLPRAGRPAREARVDVRREAHRDAACSKEALEAGHLIRETIAQFGSDASRRRQRCRSWFGWGVNWIADKEDVNPRRGSASGCKRCPR